jgi:TRAP-type C4-dicarboxylate transport system substrate-binding protein
MTGLLLRLRCLFGVALLLAVLGPAGAQPPGTLHLRVVGGIAGVNQYERHEEPFWTSGLRAASGGRITAEIAPFDRTGIRAQEALRLAQLGVTPFATVLLAVAGADDPVLAAPDLAGLNGDMAALRRTVAAYRPTLARRLRELHGVELLAVYTYPAQVVSCTQPFGGLADLAGRRVRGSSASQSDFLLGLGAVPVTTGFAEIVAQMRAGGMVCAITAASSARSIGMDMLTTHVSALPVSFGLSAFVANAAAWSELAPDQRTTLQTGLAGLERAIWQSAERESDAGLACLIGRGPCAQGTPGRLTLVPATADDQRRRAAVFRDQVLVRWLARCGADCRTLWDAVLAPVAAPR